MSSTASFCAIYFFVKYLALFTLVLVIMSSIALFLVFMSGGDGSSMGASSEPPTTQWKVYRPRGLQAVRGGLIPIQFDDAEQPIGPNRKFLCTFIGETTRENLSPLVGDWRDLEEEDKEYIRKAAAETFDLDPDEHQVMLDYKANMALKNWKSRLRTNNYDAYETNEERKRKIPKGVKKEGWIEFVDRLSTPEEQAKHSCQNLRLGKPRITNPNLKPPCFALEKGIPKGSVKRSEIFLACHTKEDGTYPEEMKERMERMNRAIQKDPMLMDKDLDNDAVAVEYGADGNGHVRGCNGHLNKTNIRVSAPLRRVIERERVKQAMLNDVQESLEVEANERRQLEKRVAAFESRESPRGAYMHRPFENNISTSQISIELSETLDIYRTILVDKERNVENNKTLLEYRPL
ncbi:hypothetical protein GIB67_005346 [Kingdonia uniflora]|uniref:Uncharacterized protein n=1 Tax=Kingdonia uniflora TaxID=39325 RepID=A0A7J7NCU9_9MAGN|nr:hypothetical protein GIB67_005346 [Kingdonia uniflora]